MRLFFSIFVFLLLLSGGTLKAQKNSFRLPKGMKPGADYEQGVVIARLKADLTAKQRSAWSELQNKKLFSEVLPAFPQAAKAEAALRKENLTFSLNDFVEIKFAAAFQIEKIINDLLATDAFLYAEPALIHHTLYSPNDPLHGNQYYLELTKTYEGWDIHKGDSSIIIGIVDSGFDFKHPDLKNKFKYNQADPIDGKDNDNDGFIDNHKGWDFAGANANSLKTDNDPQVTTGSDHGIAVAGCAAAHTDNSEGVAGIGFNCKILATKHGADAGGTGIYRTWDGILYQAMHGAKVINCSFGSSFSSPLVQDVINKAVYDYDAAIIAAAGNDGSDEYFYPASYDNVLSVGASDGRDAKSSFSNTGYKVDIVAPGSNIFITHHSERGAYKYTQGTSFSSPIVAGAAGLVRAKFPELTALEVIERLRATADTVFYMVNSSPTVLHTVGRGRLDVYRALTENPPSLRVTAANAFNNNDEPIIQGETGYLALTLKNFLEETHQDMTGELTVLTADVTVTKKSAKIGKVKKGESTTLGKDGFGIKLNRFSEQNKRVMCKIEYFQPGFTDYEFFELLINQSFTVIAVNRISTSVDSRGMIGYHDDDRTLGESFRLDDEQRKLFELSFMLGQSKTVISNAARPAENDKAWDKDFVTVKQIRATTAHEAGMFMWEGEFTDGAAVSTRRVNVRVKHAIMAWNTLENDNFIISDYKIYGTGGKTHDNLHVGLFADWDISENGQKDFAAWHEEEKFGYVYDAAENYFAGIKVLKSENQNYYAINNNQNANDTPFGLYDGFTHEEKFLSLSSDLEFTFAGQSSGGDISHTVAYGPHQLKPKDSMRVAYVLMAGKTLEELVKAAKNADKKYKEVLAHEEKPLAAEHSLRSEEWRMYPNPAENIVRIQLENTGGEAVAYELCNVLGQKLRSENLVSDEGNFSIDLKNLPSGMYFLRLSVGNRSGNKTLIIR